MDAIICVGFLPYSSQIRGTNESGLLRSSICLMFSCRRPAFGQAFDIKVVSSPAESRCCIRLTSLVGRNNQKVFRGEKVEALKIKQHFL